MPPFIAADICHDLLNLYNDQDQEAATKEVPSRQVASATPPPSLETLPTTLAGTSSLPAVTYADMHAQPSDQQQQQQPDPPPLPPPPGTHLRWYGRATLSIAHGVL